MPFAFKALAVDIAFQWRAGGKDTGMSYERHGNIMIFILCQ